MMTAAELITTLQAFPPETRVVVAGFDEFGIEDVGRVELIQVAFDVEPSGGHGAPHDKAGDEGHHPDAPATPAVLINF